MIHLTKFNTLPTDSLNAVNNCKAFNLFCMIHDFMKKHPPNSKQKAIFDTRCFITKPMSPMFTQKEVLSGDHLVQTLFSRKAQLQHS